MHRIQYPFLVLWLCQMHVTHSHTLNLAIEDSNLPNRNNIEPKILPIKPVVIIKSTVIVSVPPSSCDTSIPTAAVIDQ